jgi:hypothetical protein
MARVDALARPAEPVQLAPGIELAAGLLQGRRLPRPELLQEEQVGAQVQGPARELVGRRALVAGVQGHEQELVRPGLAPRNAGAPEL